MFSADFEPANAVGDAWNEAKAFALDCGASHLYEELTLLLEPGRSIIADAGVCLTTIRNQKMRRSTNPKSKIQDPKSIIGS
jgi:diaminopimelate decarboxylase